MPPDDRSLDIEPGGVCHSLVVDRDTNVELGDCDVEAESGELRHALGDVLWGAAADKVALEPDAVEGVALVQQLFGETGKGLGLVVDGLNVVVVDVELDVGSRGVGVVQLLVSLGCKS